MRCDAFGAQAILVPRSRFAPVKTTNDLLALLSDAYRRTPDHRVVLAPERAGVPPNVKLDGMYKFVDQMMELVAGGAAVPSLVKCTSLVVDGWVVFEPGVIIQGDVKVSNVAAQCKTLKRGVYSSEEVRL